MGYKRLPNKGHPVWAGWKPRGGVWMLPQLLCSPQWLCPTGCVAAMAAGWRARHRGGAMRGDCGVEGAHEHLISTYVKLRSAFLGGLLLCVGRKALAIYEA